MVVFQITPNLCYGNCKKVENGSLLIEIDDEDKVIIGPFDLSEYDVTFYRDAVVLFPGERKIIGRIFGKNEYVYVEYPDGNRIVLDYDLYSRIYTMMETLRLEKQIVNGIEFYSDELEGCMTSIKLDSINIIGFDFCIKNDYDQTITKETIVLRKRDFEQPFFIKDGIMWKKIVRDATIDKGECRIVTSDGKAICYGEPQW